MAKKKKLARPPKWLHPTSIENKYEAFLQRAFFKPFRKAVLEFVIPNIGRLANRANLLKRDSFRADTWMDDLDVLMESVSATLSGVDIDIKDEARKIAFDVSQKNSKEWSKIKRKVVGVDLFAAEPWLLPHLQSFTEQNVDLINNLQDESIRKMRTAIQQGIQGGRLNSQIAQEVQGLISGTTVDGKKKKAQVSSRAKFIARDQVAKLNGQLTQLRQTEVGITKYIWRTADDERVRGSQGKVKTDRHDLMDDKICRWDNPNVYLNQKTNKWVQRPAGAVRLHPGQDYQCRCYAEPVLDDLLE